MQEKVTLLSHVNFENCYERVETLALDFKSTLLSRMLPLVSVAIRKLVFGSYKWISVIWPEFRMGSIEITTFRKAHSTIKRPLYQNDRTKLDKDRSRDDSFSIHIYSPNDSFDQDQITENSLKINWFVEFPPTRISNDDS